MTRAYIGTSGWHYKHWKGNFYPARIDAAEMLQRYVKQLDTVEINNSFYRLPSEEIVRNWVKQTPLGFVFAVKASRYITHNRKLRDPQATLAKFMQMAGAFGEKLGPLLFQLPPGWGVNEERLQEFLAILPRKYRYAFEFRNPSWHTPRVCQILRQYNAAFCIFDLNGFQSEAGLTADFAYVRLHGPGAAYQGDYSMSDLRGWARTIRSWMEKNLDAFVYFDNDQAGFAAKNAVQLRKLMESRSA
jgi:uncharacterized protein YecE (DUF72 family)